MQVQTDNYKGGLDINTSQYTFTGLSVCNYQVHNNASGNISNMGIKTNRDYDHAGRLLAIQKIVNTAPQRTVVRSFFSFSAGCPPNKK